MTLEIIDYPLSFTAIIYAKIGSSSFREYGAESKLIIGIRHHVVVIVAV